MTENYEDMENSDLVRALNDALATADKIIEQLWKRDCQVQLTLDHDGGVEAVTLCGVVNINRARVLREIEVPPTAVCHVCWDAARQEGKIGVVSDGEDATCELCHRTACEKHSVPAVGEDSVLMCKPCFDDLTTDDAVLGSVVVLP